MWTVTINNIENGVADVTATEDSGFSWNSIIKVGDIDGFAQAAKDQLTKYQEIHKNDTTLKSDLESLLNK